MKKSCLPLALQFLLAGIACAAEDANSLNPSLHMQTEAPAGDSRRIDTQAQAGKESGAAPGKTARGKTLAEEWTPEEGIPLKTYKQIYFLVTRNPDPNDAPSSPNPQDQVPFTYPLAHKEAKFQISIKSALIDISDRHALWAGYSQLSFWQVFDTKHSNPFRETNYEPELIYSYRPQDKQLGGMTASFINAAIDHQSNGQSLPRSRSWNRLYIQAGLEHGFGDNGRLAVLPRYWKRFGAGGPDDDNPDILNYLGHGDVEIRYYYRHGMLSAIARSRSVQVDLALPPWLFGIQGIQNASLHLQYFHGYGESLIDYNQGHTTWGIGLSLPFEDSF